MGRGQVLTGSRPENFITLIPGMDDIALAATHREVFSKHTQPLLVSNWLVADAESLCQLHEAFILRPKPSAWRQQRRRQQSQVDQTTSESKQLFALDEVSYFIEVSLPCLRKRCDVSQRASARRRRRTAR